MSHADHRCYSIVVQRKPFFFTFDANMLEYKLKLPVNINLMAIFYISCGASRGTIQKVLTMQKTYNASNIQI